MARRLGKLLVVVIALCTAIPAIASASSVTPTTVSTNPGCADLNSSWTELKIDRPPMNTTYSDKTLSVEITDANSLSFNWESNIGVDAVIVKAATDSYVYSYSPESTGDTGVGSQDKSAISHVTFCYDTGDTSPPPTCEQAHAGEADSDGDGIVDACDSTPMTTTTDTPQQTTAPEQQQQGTAPAAGQPGQIVLGERVAAGTARLLAPTGCAARTFTAGVRGSQIRRVVFKLDGKRIATVTKRNAKGLYALRINPAKYKVGVHRLVVTVTFNSASRTRARTLRASFQRCGKRLIAPRFTG